MMLLFAHWRCQILKIQVAKSMLAQLPDCVTAYRLNSHDAYVASPCNHLRKCELCTH